MTTARSTRADPSAVRADGLDVARSLIHCDEQPRVAVDPKAVHPLRIRKQVVTKEVTRTITVRSEELTIDEEPVQPGTTVEHSPGNRDLQTMPHEERVEVRVKRVTVQARRVAGSTTITDVLNREQIDLDQHDQKDRR